MVSKPIQRVVVTGGTGYVGSLLTDFLQRSARLEHVASWSSRDADVRDLDAVRRALAAERPDAVFHLAAKADTDGCERRFDEARAVNVQGSLHVVQAGLEAGCRVVYFSSACLYPDNAKAYDESGPLAALCKYTETKLEAEQVLEPYADRILTIRARQPFSNHRHPRNLLAKLASYTRFIDEPNSMTHLEEAIPVIWKLTQGDTVGPLNITNEGWTTPWRIAEMIRRYWQPEMPINKMTYEELLDKVAAPRVNALVDCSRLHALGYRLRPVEVALEDALTRPCDLGDYDWESMA
jgi:nucleoside-diphosphate-sugar epimerase